MSTCCVNLTLQPCSVFHHILFVFLLRLMADLSSASLSGLTSFVSTLLPPGFAVGPSQLCEYRLGLWWVGRSLEAGFTLSRDTEWAWRNQVDSVTPKCELLMNTEFKTSRREKDKVTSMYTYSI